MGKDTRILCWGDQCDGTYRNPVLFADFSDPDVIRVGNDFYLIASDFNYMEHLGRVCHLVPYRWQDDDWPKFAEGNVCSMMSWEKPNVGAVYPLSRPEVCDEFNEPSLNPIWQWNHNPVYEKWSLTEHPGFLRLKSMPAPDHANARNTLTQKIWDTCGIIDVKLNK